jgi:hypothetical protein
VLFLKDQITPKEMNGNLQDSSSQNIQNPSVTKNIDKENGDYEEGK